MSALPLPSGWATAPIADVIREVRTTDPSTEPNAEITYFDISSIDNEAGVITDPKVILGVDAPSRARQIVEPWDVLFSTVRPNLRAVALVPEVVKGIASTGFCVLRAAKSVDPRYLHFFVRSEGFLDALLPLQRGVSYPAVRSGDVVSQFIPLPPAAEQTRIVEKLEELLSDLDAGAAELKAAQKKLARFRQSLLKAAVEGALTAEWRKNQAGAPVESGAELLARVLRERRARWEARQLAKFKEQGKTPPTDWQAKYPEPAAPDTTGLPVVQQGWVWASLDQMLYELRSGTAETSGRDVTAQPVLKSSAVRQGRIDLSELNYFREAKSKRSDSILELGDVLITRLSGSVDYVGCCAVVRVLPLTATQYPDRIFCGKPALQVGWLADFLECCFQSAYGRKRIESAAKSTAGHQRISLSDLRPFPIPLPSSLEIAEIMKQVGDGFQRIEAAESDVGMGLKKSAAQRKNLLQAAFSGKLVPQDKSDEPASVLLERIRTERTARAAETTPRRRSARKTQ